MHTKWKIQLQVGCIINLEILCHACLQLKNWKTRVSNQCVERDSSCELRSGTARIKSTFFPWFWSFLCRFLLGMFTCQTLKNNVTAFQVSSGDFIKPLMLRGKTRQPEGPRKVYKGFRHNVFLLVVEERGSVVYWTLSAYGL